MAQNASKPRVCVIMPAYNRCQFIPRAIDSLREQSLTDWELVIVDDGSTDATREMVQPYLADSRIHYHRLGQNAGLGAALNAGLAVATAPLVAYLPSDDVLYRDHLSSLADCLEDHPDAVLAYSGLRHHYNRSTPEHIDGHSLQLVQVMHRATGIAGWSVTSW